MSTQWQGKLEFDGSVDCKCEEKVSFKYIGIVHIVDSPTDEMVGTVSLSTQESVNTTYSIKSEFIVEQNAVCENCKAVHRNEVKCVLSYTHPITEKTKAMVVVMNEGDHQVVSVPLAVVD